MPHLPLVGHWKSTQNKNKLELKHAWVLLSLYSDTQRSQTRLQLNLVFAFTQLSGCDLWATVDSPRQGALVQPRTVTGHLPQSWLNWKRTLKDTEVRHIRHTQRNAPWLRTLSPLYLPPPTCTVMHLCCSAPDGWIFTSLFIYSNYLWHRHFMFKQKSNIRKGHFSFLSPQHSCFI